MVDTTPAPELHAATSTAAGRAPRLLRTAGLVAVITALGSLLGLVRDVLLARYFGASADTDAFLVAWTVPETATPLLMEGAMALLLVPLMSRELELRGTLDRIIARTFLPALGLLALLSGAAAVFAPEIVGVLTPGLENPELAVRCFRAAALTVLFLGTSGYLMAVLRASGQFFVPACVYVAYNVGILALIVPLHSRYGVFVAAVGLSVGSALMVAIQLPAFLHRVSLRVVRLRVDRALIVAAAAYLPLGLYVAGRQAQIYVERFLGSSLDPGTISQLNYASKIAQIPMVMVTTVAMVSLPGLSRDAAAERLADYRRRIEHNLRLGIVLILPAMALLITFAPEIVRLLFERGAFTGEDTASTAGIMRVYTIGLLGQVLVGFAVVCFFSRGRRTWFPGLCALLSLAVTILVSAASFSFWGARGLALGNAAGITVAGGMLLVGVRRRVAPIDLGGVLRAAVRCGVAAVAAWSVGGLVDGALPEELPVLIVLVLGATVVLGIYVVVCSLLGVDEIGELLSRLRGLLRPRLTTAASGLAAGSSVPAEPTDNGRSPESEPAELRASPGRHLLVLVVAALVGAIIGAAGTAAVSPTYTARATLLVSPASDPPVKGSIDFAQAAARLVTKQSVIDAGNALGDETIPPGSLRVTATPNSPLFEVTVDSSSPVEAARLCNRVAQALADRLTRAATDTRFRVTVSTDALPPDSQVSPDRRVMTLVGGLLGGMCGLVALVLRASDRRRRSAAP